MAQALTTDLRPRPRSRANGERGGRELRVLASRHWLQLATTYVLFTVENALRLAQPFLLGWAINDLLRSSTTGLMAFAGGHVGHMTLRFLRQAYDTRVFSHIYAERATQIVVEQRASGVETSRVAARSALARQFTEFLERHVPMVMRSGYSIVGALAILAYYDPVLVLYCLGLTVPALILNFWYSRKTLTLGRVLHDRLEDEVSIVEEANADNVRTHYQRVTRQQIRMSDWEAITAGLMEMFVLAVMLGVLVRYCSLPSIGAGDIFAVFRYVILFIMALDSTPMVVQKLSLLRDIGRRI